MWNIDWISAESDYASVYVEHIHFKSNAAVNRSSESGSKACIDALPPCQLCGEVIVSNCLAWPDAKSWCNVDRSPDLRLCCRKVGRKGEGARGKGLEEDPQVVVDWSLLDKCISIYQKSDRPVRWGLLHSSGVQDVKWWCYNEVSSAIVALPACSKNSAHDIAAIYCLFRQRIGWLVLPAGHGSDFSVVQCVWD